MAKFNDQFKHLPFDKIESIWYPFAVMSSRISLIVSCWYALNPKLETAPAVATNDIAPFKISNLRITKNLQMSKRYIIRGNHTSISITYCVCGYKLGCLCIKTVYRRCDIIDILFLRCFAGFVLDKFIVSFLHQGF